MYHKEREATAGQTYFSQYGNIVFIKNVVVYTAIKWGRCTGKPGKKLKDSRAVGHY